MDQTIGPNSGLAEFGPIVYYETLYMNFVSTADCVQIKLKCPVEVRLSFPANRPNFSAHCSASSIPRKSIKDC